MRKTVEKQSSLERFWAWLDSMFLPIDDREAREGWVPRKRREVRKTKRRDNRK